MLGEGEPDIFPDFQGVKKGSVLKQHAELPAYYVHVSETGCGDDLAVDLDRPRIRCQDTDDAFDEHTFPNTALADDDDAFPRPNVQIGPVQDDLVPEGLLQVTNPYSWLITHQNRNAVRK